MDEYVRRKSLKERFRHVLVMGNDGIMKLIDKEPCADVVEVVRCKDCKYWQDKNSKRTQGICLCGEKDMNYGGEFYPFANDFCSYGTPKERGADK